MLEILDQSVAKLAGAIADLPLESLEALLEAETNGKTRASAIRVIEEAIDNLLSEEPSNTITNTTPGFTLHLGDGRKLECGESAEVGPALAKLLRQ